MSLENAEVPAGRARLDSWKMVARHLGRSTRTVQRWGADHGLPVHRVGGDSGSVFAFAHELDEWKGRHKRIWEEPVIRFSRWESASATSVQDGIAGFAVHASSPVLKANRSRAAQFVLHANSMLESASDANLGTITRYFREAVDLDPLNAAAFAGLSYSLMLQGALELVRSATAYEAGAAAARKALELDTHLPQAKSAAAWVRLVVQRDLAGALRAFHDVLRKDPRSPSALAGKGLALLASGESDQGSLLLLKAAEVNPLSAILRGLACWGQYLSREHARTLRAIHEARTSGQSGVLLNAVEALTLLQSASPAAYLRRIEMLAQDNPRDEILRGALAYAYAANGREDKARNMLRWLVSPEVNAQMRRPYAVALALLGLKDRQRCVQYLDASYRQRSLWSIGFQVDPIHLPLRDDPEFRAFWNRIRCNPEKNV